jgi:hypothetical protein
MRFGEVETHLPIDFQIPYACRPCDDSDSDDSVSWKLEVRASVPGEDLSLDFEVPVYKTTESDPSVGRSAESIAAEREVVESQASPQPRKIREERDEFGNPCLRCSCWPGASMGLVMLVMAIAFGGVAVFAAFKLTEGEWFFLLFLLVFGFFAIILVLVAVSFLGSFRISFNRDGLTVVRNYVLFRRRKTIARDLIDRFEYKESASSGNTKYYAVHAVSPAGVKTKIAGMLKGKTTAKWLKRRLKRELGIASAETHG